MASLNLQACVKFSRKFGFKFSYIFVRAIKLKAQSGDQNLIFFKNLQDYKYVM